MLQGKCYISAFPSEQSGVRQKMFIFIQRISVRFVMCFSCTLLFISVWACVFRCSLQAVVHFNWL